MAIDAEATHSSRERLLESGKVLFARMGFERTSTAAIAREAGTSESQLMRYFHGKAGLLEAIFNESWQGLNQRIQQVVMAATDAKEALIGVLETVITALGKDADLAYLLLFEGRRVRGASSEILLSQGFTDFEKLLGVLIHRGRKDGTFHMPVRDEAIVSALLGSTEAMIRDRVMAQRAGREQPFSDQDVRTIFLSIVMALGRES